jgi:hypothetical protein
MKLLTLVLIFITFGMKTMHAWVYPEHRDIALRAIQNLNVENRALLDKLWAEARKGYELRLTETVIDAVQSINPTQLDYASWPAISGDHSCSAQNMLHNVLEADWILEVADINAQLKINLSSAEDRNMRINALRESDIRLQNADPNYATRAGSNNVHFLHSLPDVFMSANAYFELCVKEGTALNSVGAYSWFHYSAILKISRLSDENLTAEERSVLILAALADEAFALHFLEDMFAAGHVAGTWGDASQRKGTHDYYNEKGLKTNTWDGKSVVLTGDAWMRSDDAQRVASVVQISIEQLLDAANGKQESMLFSNETKSFESDSFNVCKNNFMPYREVDSNIKELLKPTLIKTPIPGLEQGLGKLPRFRAELGMFVGFVPVLRGSLLSGGFGTEQKTAGLVGGLEESIRFGVGLDGVLNESGDGLAFLGLGWRQDGSSTAGIVDDPGTQAYGNLLAAIPGRSAFSARLRIPFYVVPGDLLIAAPILFFVSPETLIKMGATAVNGGLIPWQAGLATSFGRFQFILGREMAVYFFGRTKERDALFNISPDEFGVPSIYILSYRSTQFEFPIVEYRPFSSFETEQRSSLFFQLYGGFDIPQNVEVLSTSSEGKSPPELKTVWYLGVRLLFDWRHYF